MKSNSLFARCRVNTNIDNDVFVGVMKKDDYYEVSFPIGYHLSTDEKGLRKDILSLMSVLSKYTDRKDSEFENGLKPENGIPFQAYLYVIKDFFDRGYYKEREQYYQIGKKGKINWSRTIKNCDPVIQNNQAYYLDYVVKKNTVNEDELISLIHKYCVFESFYKFGWLFTSYIPQKPHLGLTKKMMKAVVNDKLQNTFKDQNKQLFKNMLAIIECFNDDSETDFKCGTYRFEYVWEKLIDRTFGISNKSDYFPKTTWHTSDNRVYDNSYLEPDSIMVTDGKIYVLDAKYYKYGSTANPSHLPESTSINKQITYGEYIATSDKFYDESGHPDVYNAFIMPYDSRGIKFPTGKNIHYIGTATSDWKDGIEKYQHVIGILMDVNYLMGLASSQDQKEIFKLAKLIEEKCSC